MDTLIPNVCHDFGIRMEDNIMKNEIDKVLHTSGYLPPRNEEEMIAFEKVFSKIKVRDGFRVDVAKIVNNK